MYLLDAEEPEDAFHLWVAEVFNYGGCEETLLLFIKGEQRCSNLQEEEASGKQREARWKTRQGQRQRAMACFVCLTITAKEAPASSSHHRRMCRELMKTRNTKQIK